MAAGGAAAGTEVAGVVEVAAVEDGVEASLAGDGLQLTVELVFAVEAAVGVVLHVVGVIHLARVDAFVSDADCAGKFGGLGHLGLRDGGGDAGDGEGAAAEDVMRHSSDEGGIDAAGEGDDGGREVAENFVEAGELRSWRRFSHGGMITGNGDWRLDVGVWRTDVEPQRRKGTKVFGERGGRLEVVR
jgi:hypothetical protein